MSRLVSLLQKFNFIGSSVNEPDDDRDSIPVYTIKESLPQGTHLISDRILIIPFPDLHQRASISAYLNTFHGKKYMIWNISDKIYDTSLFGGQVLDFVFPGFPNPPLQVIFSIINSMNAWLNTDEENVIIIHGQNNKSRSIMLAACLLSWKHENISPIQGISEICQKINENDRIISPSQVRYLSYYHRILLGERPVTSKLHLHRIILNNIPAIEEGGIKPIIKIFQNKGLAYSSDSDSLQFFSSENLFISFDLDVEIEGDVLIICKHLTEANKLLTTFKVMFHTAFANQNVLHIIRNEIDLACNDEKYSDYFAMDLFFDKIEEVGIEKSNHLWVSVERSRGIIREDVGEDKGEMDFMNKFSIGDIDEDSYENL